MKGKISSICLGALSSYKTTIYLLISYGVLLGIATWVEKNNGTAIARQIYYHPIVGILWFLLILNWTIQTIKNKLSIKQHLGYYLLHTSFIFIIGGAIFSHFMGIEGTLHLRKGEQSNEIYTNQQERHILPFQVYLNDFQLSRYPGSNSPRSYKSIVTIYEKNAHSRMEIYMNKVISIQHYRLFQTAYDEDEAGTILTVSYDPIGMFVTYTGYALLFIGILLLPFQNKSRIRSLIKKLELISIFLLIPYGNIQAQTDWSQIQVQNPNGRMEPIDTYCRTLVRKIHHSEKIGSMNATTFILDLISRPNYWNNQPIIYLSNKEIQNRFNAKGKNLRFNDLFDTEGNYLLKNDIENIYNTPSNQHTKLQKDLLKLDEKINILLTLEQGKMLPMFPLPNDERQRWFSPGDDLSEFTGEDSLFVSHIMPWYISEPNQEIVDMISIYQQKRTNCPLLSPKQMQLEQFYNRIRPFRSSAFGYLFCGILLLGSILLQTIHKERNFLTKISKITATFIIIFFLLHTTGLIIRWYIGEQAPWSNAYESMIYAAWCTLGGSLLFIKRSLITIALGAFFSGIILLVANMNWMDPTITPLVPVLQSYWLMIHVAIIMAGYGFLTIGFLLGIMELSLMAIPKYNPSINRQIKEMAIINEISLLIGLCLMTAGTFLGAIWANEAWGRYWGWDPKETWALITILVYTAITHTRFIPKLNNEYVLSSLSVFGFSTILMTYFGVNYYLNGMHSYGNNNAPFGFYIFIIIYLLIVTLCLITLQRHYYHKKYPINNRD